MYVNPEFDIKAKAPTWNDLGIISALVLIILSFIIWPKFTADKAPPVAEQIVVSVEAVIAMVTSVAPRPEASLRSLPSSICLKIFSSTTMELSTIIPTPKASPQRVTRFMV